MSSTAADGSEDVNDFLQRIKELGDKRDQEDEERNRKLEEEILQGRAERQARRAERARSISPTKSSPANTPTASRTPSARDGTVDDAMDRLAGSSPTKENSVPLDLDASDPKRPLSMKATPSSTIPSRNSPLSWQRRPESQSSDRPRSRPLSMAAPENAARSPKSTPAPSETEAVLTREQIAQSLALKDPAWFRQTADRGVNSPAYRRNQVEDEDRSDHGSNTPRVQMPGMSAKTEKDDTIEQSSLPPRNSVSSALRGSISSATGRSGSIGSPVPLTSAQRFEPPADARSESRVLAMSPSQGRISPDRMERPSSPTKGMGGFVQSAMMKRSDSVSKRWSVQSPTGLTRGNSLVSNRSSHDSTSSVALGPVPSTSRPNSISRDNSPKPPSRPTSSNSNATITQEGQRPGTSSSLKSSITPSTSNDNEGFIKPKLPASRSQTSLGNKGGEDVAPDEVVSRPQTPVPTSPSKTMDPKRWSPTKSSWLESALNKPESPKPKPTPPPQQQPAWMAEINKAKQKGSVDLGRSSTIKHEVNIGGLMRSPPPGGLTKPLGVGGLPGGFASGFTPLKNTPSSPHSSTPLSSRTPRGSVDQGSPFEGKGKPETPPNKDFRSGLKPRQVETDNGSKAEPEFKNVFGQLKRTKTQNYVAPDELKDNITRGKLALNITGGPKKTERKDEFKDAILKKKEDFKKAQLEGKGVIRSPSVGEQATPEALVRKQSLGSGRTDSRTDSPTTRPLLSDTTTRQLATLQKETSAPGRLQAKEGAFGGKLAGRMNPALAGLLARGPPSSASDTSRSSSLASQRTVSMSTSTTNQDAPQNAGPQLTHITKGRARGPKRKAPTSVAATAQPAAEVAPTKSSTPPRIGTPTATGASEAPQRPRNINVPHKSPAEADIQNQVSPSKPADISDAPKPLRRISTAPKSPVKADDSKPESPSKVSSIAEALQTPKSPSKAEAEIPKSQPSSPRKLDMKRRSQFLRELPDLDKTEPQLETPKPLSPTKKANTIEIPVKSREPEPELIRTPTPKSKPSPPIKSPLLSPKPSSEDISVPSPSVVSPETAKKLMPAPLSPIKIKTTEQSSAAVSPKSPQKSNVAEPETPKHGVDSQSVVSVKNATALWGRPSTSQTSSDPPRVKPPIKLPTENETAASQGSVLHSPSPVREPRPNSLRLKNSTGSARPLPTPPIKGPISPPSSAGLMPSTTPTKATSSPIPQTSEASKLVADFFIDRKSPPAFKVDTARVLGSRSNPGEMVKTIQTNFFHLSADGKKQAVPSHQERMLFEGNMYLGIHSFENPAGKKVTEVYFWIGDDVPASVVEGAQIFAQREAKSAGGKLVKLQQGKETPEFFQALGGIVITRRGSLNKYDSLAPHIICGRSFFGSIAFDEVDFAPTSLCSGFPYLISAQSGKAYLWKGKGSGIDELSCARFLGMDFGLTGEVEEIDDGNEPQSFLDIFGSGAKIPKSADHWRLKPSFNKYCGRLFRADSTAKSQARTSIGSQLFGSTVEQIVEVSPFSQGDISPSNIYILDAFFEIYIIVGSQSQSQYVAFHHALLFASEYGILAASMEDRPFVPITNCVLEGVPRDLKSVFRKWRDELTPTIVQSPTTTLSRGRSLRVVPLTAALEATRA